MAHVGVQQPELHHVVGEHQEDLRPRDDRRRAGQRPEEREGLDLLRDDARQGEDEPAATEEEVGQPLGAEALEEVQERGRARADADGVQVPVLEVLTEVPLLAQEGHEEPVRDEDHPHVDAHLLVAPAAERQRLLAAEPVQDLEGQDERRVEAQVHQHLVHELHPELALADEADPDVLALHGEPPAQGGRQPPSGPSSRRGARPIAFRLIRGSVAHIPAPTYRASPRRQTQRLRRSRHTSCAATSPAPRKKSPVPRRPMRSSMGAVIIQ